MEFDATSVGFFCWTGTVLGLSAGLVPGPLTALVVAQSLRFGFREGAVVALAPLFTDAFLVTASVLLFTEAAPSEETLGVLSCASAVFVLYLAWDTAAVAGLSLDETKHQKPHSLRKSVITNLVNPHAYFFWFVIGGPLVAQAKAAGGVRPWCFLVMFFGCLVGSKVVIAWYVVRLRRFFIGGTYRTTMRMLGGALAVSSILFLVDGFEKLQ